MNRLANASNRYQGPHKRVLCVCSAGLLRSPTIAWVLSNAPYQFNVRAAGVSQEYALVPVDEVLLEWAHEVVCADQDHADAIHALYKDTEGEGRAPMPVHVLNVPDSFRFRDPELVKLIEAAVKQIKWSE